MQKKKFNWTDFNSVRKQNPPRDTLVFALKKFSEEKKVVSRSAFDIGCGPGNDVEELLKQGWKVTATDSNSDVLNYLMPFQDKYPNKLSIQIASFEDIVWKKSNLVNASFTLPFCPDEHFGFLWKNIHSNIKKGGRFSGQFFGTKDEWKKLVRHSKEDIKKLFKGFEFELLSEIEKYDTTSDGTPKNWHYFSVVARKIV